MLFFLPSHRSHPARPPEPCLKWRRTIATAVHPARLPTSQGKSRFINRDNAAHFHLVHRSQRDPKVADPEAPQRVLAAAELGQRKGKSQADSLASSRAWAAEQDLAGFEGVAGSSAVARDEIADLGMPEDGYDYAQHLRAMGGGTFISKDGLPAGGAGTAARSGGSVAMSSASRTSRFTSASLKLRGVAEEVFESVEELPYGVGGAHNEMNVVYGEDEEEYAEEDMDPELWAALHPDGAIERGPQIIGDPKLRNQWVEGEEESDEEEGGAAAAAVAAAAAAAAAAGKEREEEEKEEEEEEEGEEEEGGGDESDDDQTGWEELNDDFVLQADRATELVADAPRRKKGKAKLGDVEEEEEEEGEEGDERRKDGDGKGYTYAEFVSFYGDEADAMWQYAAEMELRDMLQAAEMKAGGNAHEAAAPAAASSRPAGRNPFAESDDDDDDDDDDEEEEEGGRFGDASEGSSEEDEEGRARARRRGGRPEAGRVDRREERLLDDRFARLMDEEYEDEEIGELDQDDPRITAGAELEVPRPSHPSAPPRPTLREQQPGSDENTAPAKRIT